MEAWLKDEEQIEFTIGYIVEKVNVGTIQNVALKYSGLVGEAATHCIISHNNFIAIRDYLNLTSAEDPLLSGGIVIMLGTWDGNLQITYRLGVEDKEVILYKEEIIKIGAQPRLAQLEMQIDSLQRMSVGIHTRDELIKKFKECKKLIKKIRDTI